MTAAYTSADLLDVWRRDLDPGYTQPLETEDGGRGLDPIAGVAAVLARASTAVLRTTESMRLREHSTQLAPPASGAVLSTGTVSIYRRVVVGGPIPLDDGDVIAAEFTTVDGATERAPLFEVVGDITIAAGSEGPTTVSVRAARPGYQSDVPAGTRGRFQERRGGTFTLASYAAGVLTVDTALGDRFVPTMSGMFWRFTDGLNVGAYARRITVTSPTTATIDASTDLTTQGAGGGLVIEVQAVGNFDIVFDGTDGGRTAELDYLARDITPNGRAVGEDDDAFRGRVTVLPDAISPNALIRAIAGVLDHEAIPFRFIEVFDQSVGFIFNDGASTEADSAFDDPFAYRNAMFFVGGPSVFPIGFLVVVNGLAFPAEPDLTRILSALTATIIATKAGGVPWALAFEPPLP